MATRHSDQAGAPAAGAVAKEGGPAPHVVFYACKYTPVELLAGFGAQACLAEADVASFDRADALAHPNLCGYGKGLIERMSAPDVHEVVLVTCCDVVRRVYDVLAAEGGLDFLYLLDLPHRRGEREERLLRARLADLARRYAAYSGRSFEVGRALASFEAPQAPRSDERVTLLGAHATASVVRDVREALGREVENATCTHRALATTPPPQLARAASPACGEACEGADAGGTLDSFLDWYAHALLQQLPCMRMDDVDARAALVGGSGQRGIVYHTMKFCDYYGFEYASLVGAEEVPLVKVETDGTSQSAGQLRTRLEAFAETLRARSPRGGEAGDGASAAASEAADGAPAAARGPERASGTYVMGVDSGSTSTDAVIVDGEGRVVASVILPTGARATESAERAQEVVLERAGLTDADVACRVATGYGRDAIPHMDRAITEISCHARGAHELAPQARTVIDIGGQDSKVIHLSETGGVANFVMNDKCAAGTGRFMEAMARTLEMSLDDFCREGLRWKSDVRISSVCTVFAESEVVSLVAADTPTPDVIHGLDESVARKTASLARRVGAEPPYLMTGGVAQNEGVVRALEDVLGAPVATHPESQLCGALGAALLGLEGLRADAPSQA